MKSQKPDIEKEIGKFLAQASEGAFIQKRFRIPNTKYFVFANILYDDNMEYDGYLHDAMLITLAVSPNRKLSLSSTVSVATSHVQYENFKYTSILSQARIKNKLFDVGMTCAKKRS